MALIPPLRRAVNREVFFFLRWFQWKKKSNICRHTMHSWAPTNTPTPHLHPWITNQLLLRLIRQNDPHHWCSGLWTWEVASVCIDDKKTSERMAGRATAPPLLCDDHNTYGCSNLIRWGAHTLKPSSGICTPQPRPKINFLGALAKTAIW